MTKRITLLLGLCLLLAFASVAGAANTRGIYTTGLKGHAVGDPGIQFTENDAPPTDKDLVDGRLYYDTTDGLTLYHAGGWVVVTTGTAGTADTVYNAGAWTVAVDANDVIWNVTGDYTWKLTNATAGTMASGIEIDAATASGSCVITDGILFTTSGAGATITTAIDASDAGVTNVLAAGVGDLAGTNWDIDGGTGAATFVGVTSGSGDVNVGTSKLIIAGATGKITGTAAADIDLNSVFTVDATQGNVVSSGSFSAASWNIDTITASTTNTVLTLNGNGNAGVVLMGTGAGGITLTTDVTCTLDIDIDGGDITCPADLTITPTGGDVDINTADLWIDSGKHVSFDGSTDTNYIYLSTTLQMIATGDIVLDPAGADVDIDAADLWIDGGNFLSLNGSTASNTLAFSTNLNIVGSADILLDPAGGDIDIDAADLQIDATKKLSLNGATETDAIYSSTDLQIVAAADIILTPTGTQVGVIGADLSVAGGKKLGLNAIAGLANDFIILTGSNVVVDAAADVVLDPGGGQVDVDAADLAVDAGEHISLAGIATIAEAAFIYQNNVIEVFVDEVNVVDFKADGVTFVLGQTRKEVLQATQGVVLDGTAPPSLTDVGTDGVGGKNMPAWAFEGDAGANDLVTLVWNVPDGYIANSGRLNVGWSYSDAETNDDDVVFDMAVTATAQGTAAAAGEAWDVAGTAFGEGDTNIDTGADSDKLIVTQLNFEVLDIAVDDTVLITFWVNAATTDLDASGTCDVHFFEIEWESTE